MEATATARKKPGDLDILLDLAKRLFIVTFVMAAVLSLLCFPWSSDQPLTAAEQAKTQAYYAKAYENLGASTTTEPENTDYIRMGQKEAEDQDVKGYVTKFASAYHLKDKKVLDIGAGRGYLQDVVNDYTGLDISSNVKRFYHKTFVLGSATAMPFADNTFDAAWSIWVLEHVPNPEAALVEIRRVVKDGGLLYLAPAWDCNSFAADGYPVRPYSDFGVGGKLIKATIPAQIYFRNVAKAPVGLLRYAAWKSTSGPTRLHYQLLTPNYDKYWMPDSDGLNSLDRYEMAIWFQSRGDDCLNCEGSLHGWLQPNEPLIVRIHKSR
jgi:SAM-dependent methyltransferase